MPGLPSGLARRGRGATSAVATSARAVLAPAILAVAVLASAAPAQLQAQVPAQVPGAGGAPQTPVAPQLPAELSPEAIDALLSRLTDDEVRALLRDELHRRADARAAVAGAPAPETFAGVRMRVAEMAATIQARVIRWAGELGRLEERRAAVDERLAHAANGVAGMLAAVLAVAIAGLAAAAVVGAATRRWRRWLASPGRAGYWERVTRTALLGGLEAAPIFAWVFVTVSVAPMLAAALGPMVDYVWIYEVGVSYSWGFVVISRRAFAPDAPAIRIAQLSDAMAAQIHGVVRRAVQIGAAGWLVAGLSPTLGLGFPPAMITVALAGTAVAGLLVVAAARHFRELQAVLAGITFADGERPAAGGRIAVAAAPVLLIAYLVLSWLYWIAHWLETGQQHLDGPVGTLVVLLLLPIADNLGRAIARSLIRTEGPAAERYRAVLHGAGRTLTGIAAAFGIAALWGLDLYGLAKDEDAPVWADTLFDIVVTLLIARVIWRLILAALHRDRPVAGGGEEDADDVAAASRLDTLIPLLRTLLLVVLAVIVGMIVLSYAGVNIGPLLASAGIVGIAVGFGAQTLVRDIFSGAFFLIDDAFRVGEYIELDEKLRGEVEAISIRSLQLRHHRGAVITIPFGELKHVMNHNRDWVIYKMSFRMEPDTDPAVVKRLVKEVGREFLDHPEHGPKFIEPLKSQGVSMIDEDSALIMRVKFKCRPRAQFVLRREIYHRLGEVFAENGIHLARRKVEVVSGPGAAAPPATPLAGSAALADDIVAGDSGRDG